MKKLALSVLALLATSALAACQSGSSLMGDGGSGGAGADGGGGMAPVAPYAIVDTGQLACYDASAEVACPASGQPFHGSDGAWRNAGPSYRDNGDGTVTDEVTGLTWAQARGEKMTWDEAVAGAASFGLAGHDDWRVPTIKELYSLIDFNGRSTPDVASSIPYLDTSAFGFAYGDTSLGERIIDCQDWSATPYVSTTMNGDATVFGVNFADGRIKGYPKVMPGPAAGQPNRLYVRYVRGNPGYGQNDFVDVGDGTVSDEATGLVWQQADSGTDLGWEDALAYCDTLALAGHDDWRLPDVKELQSIVDYTRSPATTTTAAIDPVFGVSEIESYFWSSTTHLEGPGGPAGAAAAYVAFGRALGFMEMPPGSGVYQELDVHGAGAQRSDPKEGDPGDYPEGHGPQGDDIRIFNFVRCVRAGATFQSGA